MIIAGAPILMMLTIAFTRHIKVIWGFSILAFIAAFLSLFFILPAIPCNVSTLFIFDNYSILFSGIIILASLLVTLLSYDWLLQQDSEKEEYFIMLFVATLGSVLLTAASNFVTLFLGLETLSISLYVLIAYRRSRDRSIEAGVKYLVLASVSSAFLLFGMGLIYLYTGSLEFSRILPVLYSDASSAPLVSDGFRDDDGRARL